MFFFGSRLYYLEADIGFEQPGFFKKGVGAGSHWGFIFAQSVGKLFSSAPLFGHLGTGIFVFGFRVSEFSLKSKTKP